MAARSRSIHHGRLAWGALVALAVGVTLASCAKKEEARPAAAPDSLHQQAVVPPQATPEPPFRVEASVIRQHAKEFAAHFRGVTFDTGAAADRHRRLWVGTTAGPVASLDPEAGAAEVIGDWAVKGRVLARLTLDAPYAKLRANAGVSYVCVRRVHPGAADSLWAFVVGVSNDIVGRVDSLALKVKPGKHSWARFIAAGDENVCFPCNSAWCCTDEN